MHADDARAVSDSVQRAKARALPHPWTQDLILRRIRKAAKLGYTSVDMPWFMDSTGMRTWLRGMGYQVFPGFMATSATIDWQFQR